MDAEEVDMELTNLNSVQLQEDYGRVEQAIRFLDQNYQRQPSLEEVAGQVGLSPYHFQRLFKRWAGISPKRFLQYLTKERAKQLLEHSENVLDTAFDSGLSGPGRLHDLFVTYEAVTPGEYKHAGEGLDITCGFHPTPFGECLIAMTARGICNLAFVDSGGRAAALKRLKNKWSRANLVEDPEGTRAAVEEIWSDYFGRKSAPLRLHLRGTNFQLKVWEALLRIPPGSLVSYQDIAMYIGMPKASRAVGRAVAGNTIAVLIPCHRVIRKLGDFGQYQWNPSRKKALIGWELARQKEREDMTLGGLK
jgi:AraC family transcriptional regulator of adaptative response/methylated-DNA-[protein]-cysteine methyltransferase